MVLAVRSENMRSLLQSLSSKRAEADTVTTTEVDHHQLAKEEIDEWSEDASTLYYCELCNGLFAHYDPFFSHRMASEYDRARQGEDEFRNYRELQAGDEIPSEANVGAIEPCMES